MCRRAQLYPPFIAFGNLSWCIEALNTKSSGTATFIVAGDVSWAIVGERVRRRSASALPKSKPGKQLTRH